MRRLLFMLLVSVPLTSVQADTFYWEQATVHGHHFGENAAIAEAKTLGRTQIKNRVKSPKTIDSFDYDILDTGIMIVTQDGEYWFAHVRVWALVRVPDGGPDQPVPPKPVITPQATYISTTVDKYTWQYEPTLSGGEDWPTAAEARAEAWKQHAINVQHEKDKKTAPWEFVRVEKITHRSGDGDASGTFYHEIHGLLLFRKLDPNGTVDPPPVPGSGVGIFLL